MFDELRKMIAARNSPPLQSPSAAMHADNLDRWGLGTDARTGVWHFFPATRSTEGEVAHGNESICRQQREVRVPWIGPGPHPDPAGLVGVCGQCIALTIERRAARLPGSERVDHAATDWDT